MGRMNLEKRQKEARASFKKKRQPMSDETKRKIRLAHKKRKEKIDAKQEKEEKKEILNQFNPDMDLRQQMSDFYGI